MRDNILKILRESGPCMTHVVRNKLHYDFMEDHTIHKVRYYLKKLRVEGVIETVPTEYKAQLRWAIKYAPGK